MKEKKPIYKKWWFWVLVILVVGMIGNAIDPKKPKENTETVNIQETNNSADKEAEYIKAVTKQINDGALGEDEVLTDVSLDNKSLIIQVDLSKVDPSPLTMDDLVWSRTSSITDAILDLTDYEDLWDNITCDFGDAGKITNGKDNIVETGFGKAFDPVNFEIVK